VKLHLVDVNPLMVECWQRELAGFPEVEVTRGDILLLAHDTLVSPANSQGHMDGGIDLGYLQLFGMQLQLEVYEAVARSPEGLLPIGAATMVRTGHPRIRHLIVAPTMEVPGAVPAEHSYRAMRALLRLADRHAGYVQDVFCPGLATGIGQVSEADAAREMARAYRDWRASRSTEPSG
jgi:O-acetyl-ADP-ribose deacetylase (regulator of RNase III)